MKASFPPGKTIHRRFRAAHLVIAVVCFIGLGASVAACGDTETTTTVAGTTPTTSAVTTTSAASVVTTQSVTTTATEAPTTTTEALALMTVAQIGQWKTEATAVADRWIGGFPDAEAQCVDFADNATFYDPCNGAVFNGKQSIVTMQQEGFNDFYPNMKWDLKDVYLSGDGAAWTTTMENSWPPWNPEPAGHPPLIDLEVLHFKNGQVTGLDVWNWASSLELMTFGVFAPGNGGPEQLGEIADRYLAAWASGDKAQIAALYHPDAVFSDSMLGLQAEGASAIAELGEERFGAGGPVTFEVIDLYAQTNTYKPPSEQQPEQGAIIAVAIHYRCDRSVDGKPTSVECLTTFQLGTRMGKGMFLFAPDPNGLITREEVFYDADSLLTSGLVD